MLVTIYIPLYSFRNSPDGVIIVDLDECKGCNSYDENAVTVQEYEKGTALLKSGSTQSDQSFFPLAIDDYFMAVAILSGSSTESKVIIQ